MSCRCRQPRFGDRQGLHAQEEYVLTLRSIAQAPNRSEIITYPKKQHEATKVEVCLVAAGNVGLAVGTSPGVLRESGPLREPVPTTGLLALDTSIQSHNRIGIVKDDWKILRPEATPLYYNNKSGVVSVSYRRLMLRQLTGSDAYRLGSTKIPGQWRSQG